MKKISIFICLVVLLLAGCRTAGQAYHARVEQGEQLLAKFLDAVQRAEGARLRVVQVDPVVKESSMAFSKKDVERLKAILLHTRRVPPPYQPEPLFMSVYCTGYTYLELLDAEGKRLDEVSLNFHWIRESDLKRYPPERQRHMFAPIWYLPDAEYEAFYALCFGSGKRHRSR